jgi:hypothetical protein
MNRTPPQNKRLVPSRLRQVMGTRTQREWSRELGIAQQTISRCLNARNAPKMDFLLQLASKDQVNLNWLVLGEGRMRRQG